MFHVSKLNPTVLLGDTLNMGKWDQRLTFFCLIFCFIEERGIKPPGWQREPGRASTQEEKLQGTQWSEPGVLQKQSPATAFRTGKQSPASPQARQEEEETPQANTCKGELVVVAVHLSSTPYLSTVFPFVTDIWNIPCGKANEAKDHIFCVQTGSICVVMV